MPTSNSVSIMEAIELFLQWAKTHNIGPLQTVTMLAGIVTLFVASRFVRSAKKVVGGVHSVYEQALEDQKRTADDLRAQLEVERTKRKELLAELEEERGVKENLLRKLARQREKRIVNKEPEA